MCHFCGEFQNHDYTVAIKCITKKNLAKSQNLLSKEIKILQVFCRTYKNYCILVAFISYAKYLMLHHHQPVTSV